MSFIRINHENYDPNGIKWLYGLILASFLLFFISEADVQIKAALAFNIGAVREFEIWRPLTAIFLHHDFFHILFNMIGLYFFGLIAAPLLSGPRFFGLFIFSGLAGNLLWGLINADSPYATVLGASGAVMGVVMAAAMLRPDIEAYILFIPFPMKLKTLCIVYIAIDIVSQITSYYAQVAYLAHIGGFIGGYLFMILFMRKQIRWEPLRIFAQNKTAVIPGEERTEHAYRRTPVYDPNQPGPVPPFEIERLLYKLSQTGINSLTEAEQETLRRAREEMKNRQQKGF